MRYALLFAILTFTLSYSQKKSEKIDSVGYYIELAEYNSKINNYKNSLDYTQKAIDYASAKGDLKAQADASSALGLLYFDLKKYDDAIEIFNKSIVFYNTLSPSSEQAYAYYNLGLCYMEKENYSEAETIFNKTQTIYQTIKIPDAIELLNLQKGIVYKAKGKYKLASSIFSSIIAKPTDPYSIKAEALYQIGTLEADQNRFNLALNYLKRALEMAGPGNNIDLRSKIYFSLSNVYEQMSDIDNSFGFLKMHYHLRDSISTISKERLGAEDYNRFKANEKLRTIEQMQKENKRQKEANRYAKVISILAIALI